MRRIAADLQAVEETEMQIEDVHRWHDDIFTRMAKAGWVESFAYTEGKGWFVTWTVTGMGQAKVLKALSEQLGLRTHDLAPLAFDAFTRDLPLPEGLNVQIGEIHPMVKEAWREAVDQIGLAGNEDGLLILMHLVSGYAPDENTRITRE